MANTPPPSLKEQEQCSNLDSSQDNQRVPKNKAEKAELALIGKRLNVCEVELKMKLLLVGSSMVGKTSLVSRFADSDADIEALKPTVLGDFHHFSVKAAGDKFTQVRVWDMGGAEKFHQTDLVLDFYRDVDAIMLVFALNDFESFGQLRVWLDRIQQHQARPLSQLDCCLIGNKSDLADKRLVSTREADAFARHHGLPYLETSALTVDNVQKAFYDLVLAVARRRQAEAEATAAGAGGIPKVGRGRQVAAAGLANFRALCCGCAGGRSGAAGGAERG